MSKDIGRDLDLVIKSFDGKNVEFQQSEDGQLWLTAREIGDLLGYASPAAAIRNIVKQHEDEFINGITQIHDTCIRGNMPPLRQRLFNLDGMILLCMFSEQPIAKRVRTWLRQVGREVLTKGRYEEPRLIAQQQKQDLTPMVTDIVKAIIQETVPAIIKQVQATQPTPIHNYPLSREYELSRFCTAMEWIREYHRPPKRFNQGGWFTRYVAGRYNDEFGEPPRPRPRMSVGEPEDWTYERGEATDHFMERCYQDYLKLRHPDQSNLFRLITGNGEAPFTRRRRRRRHG